MEITGAITSQIEGKVAIAVNYSSKGVQVDGGFRETINQEESIGFKDIKVVGAAIGTMTYLDDNFVPVSQFKFYINGKEVTVEEFSAVGFAIPTGEGQINLESGGVQQVGSGIGSLFSGKSKN